MDIQKPMEAYLDIGVVGIFRNLGRIFGYWDCRDIQKFWKDICI